MNHTHISWFGNGENIGLVATECLLVILEIMIFTFVLRCCWDNYKKSKRKTITIWNFVKEITPVKKYFLMSNFVIVINNLIFIANFLLQLPLDHGMCSLHLQLTGLTCFATSHASIFVYVWARQYYLHSAPVVKNILPKWLPILSKLSLFLTAAAYVIEMVVIWTPISGASYFEETPEKTLCYSTIEDNLNIFSNVMTAIIVTSQSVYIALFCMVVWFIKRANRIVNQKKTPRLNKIALRFLKLSVVSTTIDCLMMGAFQIVGRYLTQNYTQLVLHFDLLLNLLCMLFCFDMSRQLYKKAFELFVPRSRKPRKSQQSKATVVIELQVNKITSFDCSNAGLAKSTEKSSDIGFAENKQNDVQ